MAGIELDITEQKRTEEALKLSIERFDLAVQGSRDGLWDLHCPIDDPLNVANPIYYSPRMKEIMGVEGENGPDLLGTWVTRLHPDDRERVFTAVNAHFTRRIPYDIEYRIVRKDGACRWIAVRGQAQWNEAGDPVRMSGSFSDITERKQVEEALRESEERYRLLTAATFDGIAIHDQGIILEVNSGLERMFGYGTGELIGKHVLDLVADESRETVLAKMKNHEQGPYESVGRRKDGSTFYGEVIVKPCRYRGRDVRLVAGRDITARKQTEQALRQTADRLSLAMRAGGEGIWDWDVASNVLTWDDQMFALYGVSRASFTCTYEAWKACVCPEDVAQADAEVQMALRGEKDLGIEFRVLWPNGTTRNIRALTTVYRDASGHPLRMIGTNWDITERKRAEDELRRSHSFIRQIIDTDPNFIFAKDRDGRFTLVNKALADIYGTTVDSLIGKTDADFNANEEEVAFFRQKDLAVMDSLQDLFIPEELITDSEGRTHWLQTVKRPILDEQGRASMVLGVASDITSRKRMEETLRQREDALRAAIEERARISQDLHDGILQSLFAVGLGLEASQALLSPGDRKVAGPRLDQAIGELNRVIREVRSFIAGLSSDPLQGKDLLTALRLMLKSLTQNHALRMRCEGEDRAAQAVSAEQSAHLLYVAQEAVSNCLQHSGAQEAVVSLKMLKRGVRLSIRDNGRGFNPAVVKGAGQGLINMSHRAQKIGGQCTVSSKINEGTRVVLELPKEVLNARS